MTIINITRKVRKKSVRDSTRDSVLWGLAANMTTGVSSVANLAMVSTFVTVGMMTGRASQQMVPPMGTRVWTNKKK